MCLSPEELTVDQLQERIDSLRDYLARENLAEYYRNVYTGRLEQYETLLKEKANAGQMA